MHRTLFRLIATTLAVLAVPLIVVAAPHDATTSSSFYLTSTTLSRKSSVAVPAAGCILAQIKSWSATSTGTTAATWLTLNVMVSSRRSSSVSGSATSLAPLWTSLALTSSDIVGVKSGTVTVSMPSSLGRSARGTLWLEYPPSQTPCEFKVLASTTRGRVSLSWRYTGRSFKGSFVVQRSSDGRTWSTVSACTRSASSSSYLCSDTGLTSARTYYYRACAVSSGTACGSTAVTPPLRVRAP